MGSDADAMQVLAFKNTLHSISNCKKPKKIYSRRCVWKSQLHLGCVLLVV